MIYFYTPFQLQGKINFDNIYIVTPGKGTLSLNNIVLNSELQTCLQETSPPLPNPLLEDPYRHLNVSLNVIQYIESRTSAKKIMLHHIYSFIEQIISPAFTSFFLIEETLNIASSNILAARIGIFAQNMFIDQNSKISTTGKGCSKGIGAGLIDNQLIGFCPGSGGSYGGIGGPGTPKSDDPNLQLVCNNMFGVSYGNQELPLSEGSGGGGSIDSLLGGRGGGLAIIGMKNSKINGIIESNGYLGNIPQNSRTGSGSGGGIQVHALHRLGGIGLISADGGPKTNQGGGFGKEIFKKIIMIYRGRWKNIHKLSRLGKSK